MKKYVTVFLILLIAGCAKELPIIQDTHDSNVEIIIDDMGVIKANSEYVADADEDQIVEPEEEAVDDAVTETKEFKISADEKGFDPYKITVNKGDNVKITFNFNDEKIYYGGLDIKSGYFDVEYRLDGKPKTVEFSAEKSFTYTGYWPASGVKKAEGKVEVVE